MDNLQRILVTEGVSNVYDLSVPPHDGAFHPVGIMLHHTAMPGDAFHVLQKGRPDLSGPLVQLNITRIGHVNVITEGKAYHAGRGSGKVLEDVKKGIAPKGNARDLHLVDDTDGNPWFIGIEVDNDGKGEKYPDKQIAAIQWTCAALCRHYKWTQSHIVHHREWTSRKPDMSYTGPIRQLVGNLLK